MIERETIGWALLFLLVFAAGYGVGWLHRDRKNKTRRDPLYDYGD